MSLYSKPVMSDSLSEEDKLKYQIKQALKEIRELRNEPARYVPNYDAYKRCEDIILRNVKFLN